MRRAILTVRTQRQQHRFRRILDAGRDARTWRALGLDRADAFPCGWIVAIGTGRQPARDDRSERKEGSQLNATGVVSNVGNDRSGARTVCANTLQRAWSIPHATALTPTGNGSSLTTARVADKEKDRCANTGLLRKGQLDVTFGIRSDNRQTA